MPELFDKGRTREMATLEAVRKRIETYRRTNHSRFERDMKQHKKGSEMWVVNLNYQNAYNEALRYAMSTIDQALREERNAT